MDGEIRNTPGDRLVSRILTRVHRRPRLGLSPDFYARFGMQDPWAAPEIGGETPSDDGMVFLSAAPYYAMLRRLAAARKRRERRLAAFAERRVGTQTRVATRSWPGESAASLVASRLSRLALDEMVLPPAAPTAMPNAAAAPADATPGTAPRARAPRSRSASWHTTPSPTTPWPTTPSSTTPSSTTPSSTTPWPTTPWPTTPWPTTPTLPARVLAAAEGSARGTTPGKSPVSAAEHAGARIAHAVLRASPVARMLEEAAPAIVGRRAATARIIEVIEALPPAEQAVQIRRVLRRMGGAAPLVRAVVEELRPAGTEPTNARPAQVAARRMDPAVAAPGRAAGLRPVLTRSPAMALASAPEIDRAAAGTLATAERSEGGRVLGALPRRVASSQRALARATSAGTAAGSAVARPVAYARAPSAGALSASPVVRLAAAQRAAPAPTERATAGQRPAATPAQHARAALPAARPAAHPAAHPDRALTGPRSDLAEPLAAAQRPSRQAPSARAVARAIAASASDLPPITGRNSAFLSDAPVLRPSALSHAGTRESAGAVRSQSVLPRALPAAPLATLANIAAAPAGLFAGQSPPATVAPSRPGGAGHATERRSASAITRTTDGAYAPSRVFRTPDGRPAPTAVIAASAGAPARAVAAARPRNVRAPTAWAGAPTTESTDAPARRPGSVHAAARVNATREDPLRAGSSPAATVARSPSSGATFLDAASRAAPGASRGAGRLEPRHEPGALATRASALRSPAMAHASARSELPAAEAATLQPRVSPASRPPVFSPVRATEGATVAPRGPSSVRARELRVRGSRPPAAAAAERLSTAPVLSAAAERALSAPQIDARPSSRFTRTGPLSFAVPPLATSLGATTAPADRSPVPRSPGQRAPSSPPATRRSAGTYAARAFTASASSYAPMSAVTTPSGVWISARTAAATPGLRIVRTEAGRLVAIAPAPSAAPAGRAPATASGTLARGTLARGTLARGTLAQGTGPRVEIAEEASFAAAAAPRHRATQWAETRTTIGDATAYRGAYHTPKLRTGGPAVASAFRTPIATFADASGSHTRDAQSDGAAVVRPGFARTPARREHPRRMAAVAGEMSLPATLPTQETASPTTAAARGTASAAAGATGPTRRPGRAPLEDRLQAVATGQPAGSGPSWAARSDGAPRVRSPGGLFEQLAHATTTEEIVRVIYSRAEGIRDTPLAKSAPVIQVVEQIRQEVRREQATIEAESRPSRLGAPAATVIRNAYVQPVASTTRVRRGGVQGVAATARTVGGGDDRVMKLVKRLQGLIHLAEAEGRLADARSQVRMAEDTPEARTEGQGAAGGGADPGGKGGKQDIEALGREVLDAVTKEIELRRMRRVEDTDGSSW